MARVFARRHGLGWECRTSGEIEGAYPARVRLLQKICGQASETEKPSRRVALAAYDEASHRQA